VARLRTVTEVEGPVLNASVSYPKGLDGVVYTDGKMLGVVMPAGNGSFAACAEGASKDKRRSGRPHLLYM